MTRKFTLALALVVVVSALSDLDPAVPDVKIPKKSRISDVQPGKTRIVPLASHINFDDVAMEDEFGDDGKIIYDSDDRLDFFDASSSVQQLMTQSVVALMRKSSLSCSGGTCTPLGSSLGSSQNLCSGQAFRSQSASAFCSGTLIGTDRITTAGHCISDSLSCDDIYIVFNFRMTSSSTLGTISEANDVYTCKRYFAELYNDGSLNADWAVIQLDRAVHSSHVGAPTATSSYSLSTGTTLTMIGHPSGIPVKSASALVKRKEDWGFYVVADAFGGNSGSGIFDSSGTVVGILVRGNTDYVSAGSCNTVNTVSSSEFASNAVEQASWQHIPVGISPVCSGSGPCGDDYSCLEDSGLNGFCDAPSRQCSSLPCSGVHSACCHSSCKTCGHASSCSAVDDSDDCITCPDGFEIEAVYTDCTGRCVPTGTAASNLRPSEALCPKFFPIPDCSVCSPAGWVSPSLGLAGVLAVAVLQWRSLL